MSESQNLLPPLGLPLAAPPHSPGVTILNISVLVILVYQNQHQITCFYVCILLSTDLLLWKVKKWCSCQHSCDTMADGEQGPWARIPEIKSLLQLLLVEGPWASCYFTSLCLSFHLQNGDNNTICLRVIMSIKYIDVSNRLRTWPSTY